MGNTNNKPVDYSWMAWLSWGLGVPVVIIFIVGFRGSAGMSSLSWILVGLLMAGGLALDVIRKRLETGHGQNRRG